MFKKRTIPAKRKRPLEKVVPLANKGPVKCPQGRDDDDKCTEEMQEEGLEEIEKISKDGKKELEKKKKDKNQAMPLNFKLEKAYKAIKVPEAHISDSKFYRDGVFHADEQVQKTLTLQDTQDERGLEGLEDPEDPGFWPPIEYDGNYMKQPAYSYQSEKTGQEYNIFPFTWDQVGEDWTIGVFGKRRSGKTRFVISLMGYRLRPFFPRIVVFTKTKCSGEYSKYVPDAYIIEGFKEDVLQQLFAMQKEYKALQKEGKFTGNMNLLIVIDDCLSDGFKYKKTIDEVFFEGRHLDVCFIISSQDLKGVNPACTGNTDLAVTFHLRSERDKEAIRTKYCDFFKNDDEMGALTDQITSHKWHCVAFDQHLPHIKPEFTVFGGRAPDPPPFVMGCKAWWKSNPKQLIAIVNEFPEELGWLLWNDNWGIIGEEEQNDVL